MRDRVLALREQDVRDLAAYYASKEPQALPLRKPLTLAEWTARCGRCHGAKGNSTDPRFPVLAGQDKGYLAKALEQYHLGTRDNQLMRHVIPDEQVGYRQARRILCAAAQELNDGPIRA